MKKILRKPSLPLILLFSGATLLACSSSSEPGMLFDGSTTPVAAGFSGGGDPSMVLEGKNGALSVSGTGAESAIISLALDAQSGAANSIGIRFRIRGSDNVRFFVKQPATTPAAEGGACAAEGCGDYHQVHLNVGTEWTVVTLSWGQLLQAGAATAGLNPADLTSLNWHILSADAYNVWLDDVQFLYAIDGDVTTPGGETGGNTGSGGANTGTGGTDTGTGGAPSTGGSQTGSGGSNNSTNALGKYVDAIMFQQAFPNRDASYLYSKLLEAVEHFPEFASCCSETDKKREIAAFLAHVQHESGGLRYTDEINGSAQNYCNTQFFACPAGTNAYYGRGSLQITWNYNYAFARDYLASIGDNYDLLNNPSLVTSDGLLLWLTGLWFWMEGDPSFVNDSPHDRLAPQGFGSTIRKINGALECDGAGSDKVAMRVQYFQEWCQRLGVDPGSNLSC